MDGQRLVYQFVDVPKDVMIDCPMIDGQRTGNAQQQQQHQANQANGMAGSNSITTTGNNLERSPMRPIAFQGTQVGSDSHPSADRNLLSPLVDLRANGLLQQQDPHDPHATSATSPPPPTQSIVSQPKTSNMVQQVANTSDSSVVENVSVKLEPNRLDGSSSTSESLISRHNYDSCNQANDQLNPFEALSLRNLSVTGGAIGIRPNATSNGNSIHNESDLNNNHPIDERNDNNNHNDSGPKLESVDNTISSVELSQQQQQQSAQQQTTLTKVQHLIQHTPHLPIVSMNGTSTTTATGNSTTPSTIPVPNDCSNNQSEQVEQTVIHNGGGVQLHHHIHLHPHQHHHQPQSMTTNNTNNNNTTSHSQQQQQYANV